MESLASGFLTWPRLLVSPLLRTLGRVAAVCPRQSSATRSIFRVQTRAFSRATAEPNVRGAAVVQTDNVADLVNGWHVGNNRTNAHYSYFLGRADHDCPARSPAVRFDKAGRCLCSTRSVVPRAQTPPCHNAHLRTSPASMANGGSGNADTPNSFLPGRPAGYNGMVASRVSSTG
jgi:hypothetical protein